LDKLRVIQILTNLVNNAIKFTPEDGTVDMYAKLVSREKGRDRILFSVTRSTRNTEFHRDTN